MDARERETLQDNLTQVRLQIAAACQRVGRDPQSVRLVAVTKSVDPDIIRGLYDLGCRDFGESRPQQLAARAKELPTDARWHLIGHLQRNKVDLALSSAAWIHSVDSLRLAHRLHDAAANLPQRPTALFEVNVSGEAAKDGFTPTELRAGWNELLSLDHVTWCGLMTMAPLTEDVSVIRNVFAGLRALRDQLLADRPEAALPELSMGMSGDFELAIEEGATVVRVGTRLFTSLENDGT